MLPPPSCSGSKDVSHMQDKKFALLGGQGLREWDCLVDSFLQGSWKWDPFWGNQVWCKFMVILRDFPENHSALFGLAIYMIPVLVDQLVFKYWFEFLFIVILKGWCDVAPNYGMFSSQIVEIKKCHQKRAFLLFNKHKQLPGSLSCFDSTWEHFTLEMHLPARRRFVSGNP